MKTGMLVKIDNSWGSGSSMMGLPMQVGLILKMSHKQTFETLINQGKVVFWVVLHDGKKCSIPDYRLSVIR